MTSNEAIEFIRKQEAIQWNLGELVRTLTYRFRRYLNTDKETPLYELIEKVLNKIETTSHYEGPEHEEYVVWDGEDKLLAELFAILGD